MPLDRSRFFFFVSSPRFFAARARKNGSPQNARFFFFLGCANNGWAGAQIPARLGTIFSIPGPLQRQKKRAKRTKRFFFFRSTPVPAFEATPPGIPRVWRQGPPERLFLFFFFGKPVAPKIVVSPTKKIRNPQRGEKKEAGPPKKVFFGRGGGGVFCLTPKKRRAERKKNPASEKGPRWAPLGNQVFPPPPEQPSAPAPARKSPGWPLKPQQKKWDAPETANENGFFRFFWNLYPGPVSEGGDQFRFPCAPPAGGGGAKSPPGTKTGARKLRSSEGPPKARPSCRPGPRQHFFFSPFVAESTKQRKIQPKKTPQAPGSENGARRGQNFPPPFWCAGGGGFFLVPSPNETPGQKPVKKISKRGGGGP